MTTVPNWALSVSGALIEIGRDRFCKEWAFEDATPEEIDEALSILLHDLINGDRTAVACWTHAGKFYEVGQGRWLDNNAIQFLKDERIGMKVVAPVGHVPCKLLIRKVLLNETAESAKAASLPIPTDKTGAAGRPSSRHLVEAEFKRRKASGDQASSLGDEARFLADWLKKSHPELAPMKATSIENTIRGLYRGAPLN
jgi:hypothetical protein